MGMSKAVAEHPTLEKLSAFGLGRLEPDEQAAVAEHISRCTECCDALRHVPDDTLLLRLRDARTTAEMHTHGLQATQPGSPPMPAVPAELEDHPRYRILKVLGSGGMGTVYLAEHRLMERTVALKVIGRDFLRNPTAVERFRLEVKAAGRLSHPNIVAAHDAEQAGDLHFLVMEYVDGTSLARVVEKKGPLPVVHACNYIRQAALGLQHAHEKSMVHRDIKPHNLMLSRKGQVKILDFGLARFARDQEQSEQPEREATSRGSLTTVGTVLGTPDFIAPEQVSNSRQADIRSDIYSLGCTLYYLLSGKAPFPQGSALEKVLSHVEKTPPALSELRPGLSSKLLDVVAKMMAKDPAERYQTPAEVAAALAGLAKPGAAIPLLPVAELMDAGPAQAPPANTPPVDVATTIAEEPARPKRKKFRRKTRSQFEPARLIGPAVLLGVLGLMALAALMAWPYVMGRAGQPPTAPELRAASTAPSASRSTSPGVVTRRQPGTGTTHKVLFVLPQAGVWFPDFGPARDRLKQLGVDVKVAASFLQPCLCENSQQIVQPDVRLADARASDYDAVAFVGKEVQEFCAIMNGRSQPEVRRLIGETQQQRKPIAAICAGQLVLADHGVLRGKRAAFPKLVWGLMDKFDSGAKWDRGQGVVLSDDGLVLTAAGPDDAVPFADKLHELLQKPR
jgi:serine/threonine-protein kinase